MANLGGGGQSNLVLQKLIQVFESVQIVKYFCQSLCEMALRLCLLALRGFQDSWLTASNIAAAFQSEALPISSDEPTMGGVLPTCHSLDSNTSFNDRKYICGHSIDLFL